MKRVVTWEELKVLAIKLALKSDFDRISKLLVNDNPNSSILKGDIMGTKALGDQLVLIYPILIHYNRFVNYESKFY